jgi:hypothetical protein
MTIVVEGKMRLQYFKKDAAGKLVPDGEPVRADLVIECY